ncbi:MAG: type II toxin-antitoxin system RelE/ParE family toxin [Defluviitaleaceae bacterium]|nr:type II toxin-antitoxin system RelE/ParE family toxin [Defluviitaleaceae bacterium]
MKLNFERVAAKQIGKLDKKSQQRLRKAINKLPKGDIKKLSGYDSKYRLRIGDFRVIFNMIGDSITINEVLVRGDAYKN